MHGIGAKTAAMLLADGLTLDGLHNSGWLDAGRGKVVREQFDLALKWREMIHLDHTLDVPVTPTGLVSPTLPRPADVVEALDLW